MTRELTNKDVQEYLKTFKDDAAVSMIVADAKNRKNISEVSELSQT